MRRFVISTLGVFLFSLCALWISGCSKKSEPPATNPRLEKPGQPSASEHIVSVAKGVNVFFGTASRGNKFVFIIDKSGSMEGDRLAAAKEELCRTLKGLKATDKFMVYFFSDNAEPMPMPARAMLSFFSNNAEPMPARAMLSGTPKNIRWAVKWVRTRSVQGGTDPRQALHLCFDLRPDTVWLLTDGIFLQRPGLKPVTDLIRELNKKDEVRVNTIGFHRDRKAVDRSLNPIAAANGGTFRFVNSARK